MFFFCFVFLCVCSLAFLNVAFSVVVTTFLYFYLFILFIYLFFFFSRKYLLEIFFVLCTSWYVFLFFYKYVTLGKKVMSQEGGLQK